MKKVEQMTLDEMLNAGMSVEQIDAAIKERVATREKENAEAAAYEQRKAEIDAARRQYKKAHAKYIKAITGMDISAEDMAEFENLVLIPMERAWERDYAPKKSPAANKRKVIVNSAEVASGDDIVRAIINAIGEMR